MAPHRNSTTNAKSLSGPGSTSSHTQSAAAASPSSTMIPAALTAARCQRSRKAFAAEASTYGAGVKKSKVTPISCTSPPIDARRWRAQARAAP